MKLTKRETGVKMVTFSVTIPAEIRKRLRLMAADSDTKLVPFVRDLLIAISRKAKR